MEDTPEDKTSEAEIEDSVVESEADTGKKHISEGSFISLKVHCSLSI